MLNAAVSKNTTIRENLRNHGEPMRDKAENRNRDEIDTSHLLRGEMKHWEDKGSKREKCSN